MLRAPIISIVFFASLAGAYPVGAQLATGDGLLVTPQWLSQHQHDKNIAILQVGPPGGYKVGHIAGSQFLSTRDISTPFQQGGLSLQMPAEADLIAALEKKGISDASKIVVVFDSAWVTPSARVFLTLGYIGLSQNAVYLDGGLGAWQKAGFPVTADTTVPTPGHITSHAVTSIIVDHAFIESFGKTSRAKLIDARSPASFVAAVSAQESAGHIPGAVNLPWGTLWDDKTDRLLPRAELEAKFRAAGVQPGDTVVGYCHIGQYATAMLLAARVLGHPVKLYDGSFQDWTQRKLPTVGGQ